MPNCVLFPKKKTNPCSTFQVPEADSIPATWRLPVMAKIWNDRKLFIAFFIASSRISTYLKTPSTGSTAFHSLSIQLRYSRVTDPTCNFWTVPSSGTADPFMAVLELFIKPHDPECGPEGQIRTGSWPFRRKGWHLIPLPFGQLLGWELYKNEQKMSDGFLTSCYSFRNFRAFPRHFQEISTQPMPSPLSLRCGQAIQHCHCLWRENAPARNHQSFAKGQRNCSSVKLPWFMGGWEPT